MTARPSRCFRLPRPAMALAFAVAIAAPSHAWAWGATGHRLIGRLAAESLPDDIPAFLRTPAAAEMIGELGREADRSKGAGKPHDAERDPGHFINLADDATVAGLSLDALPPTREAYDTALRAQGFTQYKLGYLPYSIVEGWQQLRKDFSYWRADEAGQRFAAAPGDRAWFARDRQLHEMLILRDMGYWSHFVGDASQPLHVSLHYNGWGDHLNPEGFTTAPIHAAIEGDFVRNSIALGDLRAMLAPYRDCHCGIEARTAAYLHATLSEVTPLYAIEKAGGFQPGDRRGREFIAERLAAAAAELRDMVVDAWRGSLDGSVGYPPIPVRDVVSGKTNPIADMIGRD